jgi:hypothetical protein
VVATADPWTCALDEVRALGMQQALMVEQAAATLGRAQADPGDAEGFAAAVLRFVRIKEHVFRTERYVLASLRPGSDPPSGRAAHAPDRVGPRPRDRARPRAAHPRRAPPGPRGPRSGRTLAGGPPGRRPRLAEVGRRRRAVQQGGPDVGAGRSVRPRPPHGGRGAGPPRGPGRARGPGGGVHGPAELWSWLGDHHRAREEALLAGPAARTPHGRAGAGGGRRGRAWLVDGGPPPVGCSRSPAPWSTSAFARGSSTSSATRPASSGSGRRPAPS